MNRRTFATLLGAVVAGLARPRIVPIEEQFTPNLTDPPMINAAVERRAERRHLRLAKRFAAALPKKRIARQETPHRTLTIEVNLDDRTAIEKAISALAAAVAAERPRLYAVLPLPVSSVRATGVHGDGRALRMTTWYDIRRNKVRTHVDVAIV